MFDLDKVFMDVAAYNQRVMGPAHVVNVVDEAIKTSLARRTVSHILIPKDIQDWPEAKGARSSANIPEHSSDLFAAAYPLPPERALRQAADLIPHGKATGLWSAPVRGRLFVADQLFSLDRQMKAVSRRSDGRIPCIP